MHADPISGMSRRTFIGAALTLVGTARIGSQAAVNRSGRIRGANEDIRVAIVGLRKKGKKHIEDFR